MAFVFHDYDITKIINNWMEKSKIKQEKKH
jgi:hypothetical protein